MAIPRVSAGGGIAALQYVWKVALQTGDPFRLLKRLRSRNTCKTCALGMGGQRGGMVNEAGHFPEICKKSIQAQAWDMGKTIPEEFFRDRPIDAIGNLTPLEFEKLGRLAFPIHAAEGATHFRRISWDEAIDRGGQSLRETPPDEAFFYASGRSSNEAAYLFQLVARAYGSANIHNCSYYCHAASGVGLAAVYGSGTASVVLDDLRQTDLAIVIGANPASNHPRLISQLINLRRRGGKVIIINPLRELGLERFRVPSDWRSFLFSSRINDLYLQPHIGTDIALLKAILIGLREKGALDQTFLKNHTAGWDLVEADLEKSSRDDLIAICGVPGEQVEQAVEMIACAPKGMMLWAMGLTHHEFGTDNVLALANIALARGWLGKSGAGMMPIRGHSNVQGVQSVGVTPYGKEAFLSAMEDLFQIRVPREPGQDTYRSMLAAHGGKIGMAVLLGGNLWGSNPDSRWAGEALRKIGHTFSITTKLNPGHVHGRGRDALIVPVLARDEEHQKTTQESMFNFVRLSDGGDPAVDGELRSEVDVIAGLAERILQKTGFDWGALRSHEKLRESIARTVPGYDGIGKIEKDGGEFQVDGRTFHEPPFATKDGRAHFHVTPIPDRAAEEDEFRLMTIRSEGQFNTVVYEEEDLYRGATRRDAVLMSAEDAAHMTLTDGDRVIVSTSVGRMNGTISISPLPRGNLAMYYPEANILVPHRVDDRSGTPSFKLVFARIERIKS